MFIIVVAIYCYIARDDRYLNMHHLRFMAMHVQNYVMLKDSSNYFIRVLKMKAYSI